MIKPNPQNRRGDKNVINGAKKTMKYVIRGSQNGRAKWQKVEEILQQNNIKNNAEAITWMYIALLQSNPLEVCHQILQHYITRMTLKVEKGAIHENEEYNERKRNREVKFITSAKQLIDSNSQQSILGSVVDLFEYENCSKKAVQKLKMYLQQNPIDFERGDQVEEIQISDYINEQMDLEEGSKKELGTGDFTKEDQLREKILCNHHTENIFDREDEEEQWECFISDDWEEMEI